MQHNIQATNKCV